MRAPAFWWQPRGLAACLLAPAAALYGRLAARRLRQAGARAPLPVLCLGDLTLGGAGKTPAAVAAAALLAAAGERPAFLTRGYGGRLTGPLRVDPERHSAVAVGDEPLLLARRFPTYVAHDRVAAAQAAHADGATVAVMDDGFQNPALAKDCAVLVVDAARGVGNGCVFPAGPLRAPLEDQLARAHGLILVGEGSAGTLLRKAAAQADKPVFQAALVPDAAVLARLSGPVLAFAGIGHPEKFFATLAAAGIVAPVRRAFPDHHAYTPREALALAREAEARRLALVTTEKDLVRLAGATEFERLRARAVALPVSLVFADAAGFRRFLAERLKRPGS